MVRSRLPLPSLLGLFGALLMLSPELFMGILARLLDLPVTDPGVQHALAFAMQQYNQDKDDSANYFKMLRVVKAQSQGNARAEYHLTVQLVKTTCEKNVRVRMNFNNIQKCQLLPGNQEKPSCYFKVTPGIMPNLAITICG